MYPQLVWVGCWAHIVDLCGDCWQHHFKLSNKFCSLMKFFFKKKSSAGRKKRWISHLKNNGVRPCLPPTANFTRWTSWLKVTQYHAKMLPFPRFCCCWLEIGNTTYVSVLQGKLSSGFEILKLHLTFLSELVEKIYFYHYLKISTNTVIVHTKQLLVFIVLWRAVQLKFISCQKPMLF